MARKNGVTSDTISDTPVIVGTQSCGLPVLPNGLARCIGFQLPNIAVAHG